MVLLSTVSLFIDMASDGYYSAVGPYLASLGATAAIIAVIAGIAGLVAFTPRIASGWYSDRTGKYWNIMAAGLVINFLAIPMLLLAGHWEVAFAVIVFDRIGKAIRSPSRDAIISNAAKDIGGAGRAFGLHEAMSDIGSIIGPIIVALVLHAKYGYSTALWVLIVPALLAVVILFQAIRRFPDPMELGPLPASEKWNGKPKAKLPRLFWVYLMATGLIAAAFIDFPLISYHMGTNGHVQDFWIPVLFAIAMVMDALSAIIFGHIYDRLGMIVIAIVFSISAFFVPLVFSSDPLLMVIGIALWGVGEGAMGSILRGAVAELVPPDRRGFGFGIFSTTFGIMWFLGGAATGMLYGLSLPLMIAVSVGAQFAAVLMFVYIQREHAKRPGLERGI